MKNQLGLEDDYIYIFQLSSDIKLILAELTAKETWEAEANPKFWPVSKD